MFPEESASSPAKEMLDLFRKIFDSSSIPPSKSNGPGRPSSAPSYDVDPRTRSISSDEFLKSARSLSEDFDDDSATGNLV
ncbi:MAG: hypothetical protein QXI51_01700, partial [Candidatus Korarchaeum sp.]